MKRWYPIFALFALVFFSGCLFVNNFEATVTVDDDYSYTVDYQGQIINFEIFADYADVENISEAKQAEHDQEMLRALPTSSFQSYRHLGRGVAEVSFSYQYAPFQTTHLLDSDNRFLTVGMTTGGEFVVMNHGVDDDAQAILSDYNVTITGVVHVVTRLPVLEHTADQVKQLIGGRTRYTFTVDEDNREMGYLVFQNAQ